MKGATTMIAPNFDTSAPTGLTQLTDDEIDTVGGGWIGLAIFLGILIVGACCNACNS